MQTVSEGSEIRRTSLYPVNNENTTFAFSLFGTTFFLLYFMNSRIKVLPKWFKCSIHVWNYGDDVNVPRSNRWGHLLCRRNAFSARDGREGCHWLRHFFLCWSLALSCFRRYLGSFSRCKTAFSPTIFFFFFFLWRESRRAGKSFIIVNKILYFLLLLLFFFSV